jgi:predicted AAA+ superfamily ATPase
VHRFFEIFEDTLLGERIYSTDLFEEIQKVKHPKFYFFDVGVMNGIYNHFQPIGDYLGSICESIIYNQLVAGLTYEKSKFKISYFRTHTGTEVDFILEIAGKIFPLEVKASDKLGSDDLRGLQYIKKLDKKVNPMLFHFGKTTRRIDNIWCMNWIEGLKELGL